MADYLALDAGRVRFDIARLLEQFPELAEDEELRADMLEGETEIDAVLSRLFLSWRQDEETAAGAKAIKADLDERQKRFERRAATKKALALSLMETADLPKRELPVATLSVQAGRIRVVVDDVEQLPQGAFETVRKPIPSAELRKLIEAEKAGKFPGAHLELGDDFLTARAK